MVAGEAGTMFDWLMKLGTGASLFLALYAIFANRERKSGTSDFMVQQHDKDIAALKTTSSSHSETLHLHTELHRRYEISAATQDQKLDRLLEGQASMKGKLSK